MDHLNLTVDSLAKRNQSRDGSGGVHRIAGHISLRNFKCDTFGSRLTRAYKPVVLDAMSSLLMDDIVLCKLSARLGCSARVSEILLMGESIEARGSSEASFRGVPMFHDSLMKCLAGESVAIASGILIGTSLPAEDAFFSSFKSFTFTTNKQTWQQQMVTMKIK